MKIAAPLIASALLASCELPAAEIWEIHWGAAKGESKVRVDATPRPLEDFLFALPKGHSEANRDIAAGRVPTAAQVKSLGLFGDKRVLSVTLEVPDSYYESYFLLLVELEAGEYAPIFIHQYAPASGGVWEPRVATVDGELVVNVTTTISGTSPVKYPYTIRLSADGNLSTKRS